MENWPQNQIHGIASLSLARSVVKVRDEMEFSVDGEEWIWGIELPDMFPQRRRRRRLAR